MIRLAWTRGGEAASEPYPPICTGFATDVGCCREFNEDFGRVIRPALSEFREKSETLAIVADGMGEGGAGAVASRMAVDTVADLYFRRRGNPRARLTEAFARAHSAICRKSRRGRETKGMGTTCTALAVWGHFALAAHVGDSRLYLIRDGEISQLTEDHSLVMELVRRGVITPEEAADHPDRDLLTRSLGTQPTVAAAIWPEPIPVHDGDRFLLCTDGLSDLVNDSEILATAAVGDVEDACRELVGLAGERGGYDNITVALLRVIFRR